jgi:hypothetical protein
MTATPDPDGGERGLELLVQHCSAVAYDAEGGPPAFFRLEQELGPEFARLLVCGLAARSGSGRAQLAA